MSMSILVTFAN